MITSLLAIGGNVGDNLKEALLPEKINFLGINIGASLITAFGVTFFILFVCLILRLTVIKNLKNVPTKIQMLLEMAVGYFDKQAKENAHACHGFIGPYIMASALFICLSTLVELIGVRPAMADINACFAFGLFTFILIQFFGVKVKKGVRLKRFLNPINIITDIAVPISLSFRLFGSIVSGLLITELVYSFVFTSFVIPSFVAIITTLFHAFIQAYIFSTLTTLFVGEAIE